MKKPSPPPYSLRIDPELRDWLEWLAQKENRPLANMIETLLKEAREARDRRSR